MPSILLNTTARAPWASPRQLAVLPSTYNALHLLIKNLDNFLEAWALVRVFVPRSLDHTPQCLQAWSCIS